MRIGFTEGVTLVAVYGKVLVRVAEHEGKVSPHIRRRSGKGAVGKAVEVGSLQGEGRTVGGKVINSFLELGQVIAHDLFIASGLV